MKNINETEKAILNAARKLFIEKGYNGSSMKNIADEANVNKTMLHYYFRSKDHLFRMVFGEALLRVNESIIHPFSNNNPDFISKIKDVINSCISFSIENPQLLMFVISELSYNPEKTQNQLVALINSNKSFQYFSEQLDIACKENCIKKTSVYELVINILSLSTLPFIAENLVKNAIKVSPDNENLYTVFNKKMVMDFILNSLKV